MKKWFRYYIIFLVIYSGVYFILFKDLISVFLYNLIIFIPFLIEYGVKKKIEKSWKSIRDQRTFRRYNRKSKEINEVSAQELRVGDHIIFCPGDKAPCKCVVVDGYPNFMGDLTTYYTTHIIREGEEIYSASPILCRVRELPGEGEDNFFSRPWNDDSDPSFMNSFKVITFIFIILVIVFCAVLGRNYAIISIPVLALIYSIIKPQLFEYRAWLYVFRDLWKDGIFMKWYNRLNTWGDINLLFLGSDSTVTCPSTIKVSGHDVERRVDMSLGVSLDMDSFIGSNGYRLGSVYGCAALDYFSSYIDGNFMDVRGVCGDIENYMRSKAPGEKVEISGEISTKISAQKDMVYYYWTEKDSMFSGVLYFSYKVQDRVKEILESLEKDYGIDFLLFSPHNIGVTKALGERLGLGNRWTLEKSLFGRYAWGDPGCSYPRLVSNVDGDYSIIDFIGNIFHGFQHTKYSIAYLSSGSPDDTNLENVDLKISLFRDSEVYREDSDIELLCSEDKVMEKVKDVLVWGRVIQSRISIYVLCLLLGYIITLVIIPFVPVYVSLEVLIFLEILLPFLVLSGSKSSVIDLPKVHDYRNAWIFLWKISRKFWRPETLIHVKNMFNQIIRKKKNEKVF